MQIQFYNTLTHRLEPFEPIEPGKVTMYNCGPTVYDYAHIGNFRSFLFADVLRRFLELAGHEVAQVMNLTDVGHMTEDSVADGGGDDKMNIARKRLMEAKKSGKLPQGVDIDPSDPFAIAEFYMHAFLEDAKLLGLKVADEYPQKMPRATSFIPQMQGMIKTLIEKAHAYVADDGAVYFDIESFPEYGKLSGNTLDQLKGGAGGRILDEHQAGKRHPADFLLWKPDNSHLMKWDSPWGAGYPGWHIECSAMARSVHGRDIIDIHTGGEDNIFPHHECEIAQSCCTTGESHFARFWMHGRHLMVEGEKMSKSKGNFLTVRDILSGAFTQRAVDPAVLRFELIKSNYRSQSNLSRQSIHDSAKAVEKMRNWWWATRESGSEFLTEVARSEVDASHPAVAKFVQHLSDDLNISGALGAFFEWMAGPHPDKVESIAAFELIDDVLNVGPLRGIANELHERQSENEAEIKQKAKALDDARAAKDYAAADTIRQELVEAGYDVKTTKDGTVATKRLA